MHFEQPMRIILNQSEKRFVSRLMKNGQFRIGSDTDIGINRNSSD